MKQLEQTFNAYENGTQDEGFQHFRDQEAIFNYIYFTTGQTPKRLEEISLGKTYPYNRSNNYSHDTYKVTMQDGSTFMIERQYGRPAWSGKVVWVERISIS